MHSHWAVFFRLLKKVYPFIKIHKDDSAKMFKKILLMLSVVNCFHKNKKLSMRSGRAGPSFSVRPEKEAKGAEATVATVACARHFSSDKIEPRTNPFGEAPQTQRLTAFQTYGKLRFCPLSMQSGACRAVKNPLTSHAEGAALCCLGLPLAFP